MIRDSGRAIAVVILAATVWQSYSAPAFSQDLRGNGATAQSAPKGERTLRDNGVPSYTMAVPEGWNLAQSPGRSNIKTVDLRRGSGGAMLIIQSGAIQPGARLIDFRDQLEKQSSRFAETASGPAVFGGRRGAFGAYRAIGPRGDDTITKVVTMTDGDYTYTLLLQCAMRDFDALRPDMDRIQSSFTLIPPG